MAHLDLAAQVRSISRSVLKQVLGRERFKWGMGDYVYFMEQSQQMFQHQKTCKALWEAHVLEKAKDKALTYKGFWKALKHVEPLWQYLFCLEAKRGRQVKPGSLVMLDTTLLPTKQEPSIRKKDYEAGHVTSRTTKKNQKGKKPKKYAICGKKGMVMLLENGKIGYAELAPINTYDGTWISNPFQFVQMGMTNQVFLADRGFASLEKRKRWRQANDVFQVNNRLIMPYMKKSKTQLTSEEYALYKNRWKIETLFQQMKHEKGDYRLCLRWMKSDSKQQATSFWACWLWNQKH